MTGKKNVPITLESETINVFEQIWLTQKCNIFPLMNHFIIFSL